MRHRVEPSEQAFWAGLHAAQTALKWAFDPKHLRSRQQMRDVSDSAYVYRLFDLLFPPMRTPQILDRLTPEEQADVRAFLACFDALPWVPLPTHPHICELASGDFSALQPLAQRLSHRLWLRAGRGCKPWWYRRWKAWPEPMRKQKGSG